MSVHVQAARHETAFLRAHPAACRRLRCLVIFDHKTGTITDADTGQMHLYVNFVREHWTLSGENPPVGVILCSKQDEALVRYALEGLPNQVLVREYQTILPREEVLAEELRQTRRAWKLHRLGRGGKPRA